VLLAIAIGAGIVFYRLATATLCGEEGKPLDWRKTLKDLKIYQRSAVIFGVLVVFSLLSWGAIHGVPPDLYTTPFPTRRPPELKPTDIRRLVPGALAFIGRSPFASLEQADVSTKPEKWTGKEDIALVKGAHLEARNLLYAKAFKAFLVNANLRLADLQGADLWGADLRGADLRGADLRGARLIEADLRRADLRGADLRGADLVMTNLEGADLGGADLQGAELVRAGLQGTNLVMANLEGADLREAAGLTASQVRAGQNWELAFYSGDFLKKLNLPRDHNERVKKRLAKREQENKATGSNQ
jgi:hypothetical protein